MILGHHKAGKSSLYGSILHQEQGLDLHKLKRDSTKAGLKNAHFSWASLSLSIEHQQKISIYNSYCSYKKDKVINFIDTPGHDDFFAERFSGTVLADVAVIVVDSSVRKGVEDKVLVPTKNNAYLAKCLGVNNVIVVLAKIDKIERNVEKLRVLEESVRGILREVGFKMENVKLLTASSVEGYCSEDLFKNIISTPIQYPDDLKPFRFQIADCYKLVHGSFLGFCISGFIISGMISKGKIIEIPQAKIKGKVKEILKSSEKVAKAKSGDWVDITLTDIQGQFSDIHQGYIASNEDFPINLSSKLRLRGITNEISIPLLSKQELLMFMLNIKCQVTVDKIVRQIIGKEVKNRPRCLKSKAIGDVDVICSREIPYEKYKNLTRMGRCVLVWENKIVFSGVIMEVL